MGQMDPSIDFEYAKSFAEGVLKGLSLMRGAKPNYRDALVEAILDSNFDITSKEQEQIFQMADDI